MYNCFFVADSNSDIDPAKASVRELGYADEIIDRAITIIKQNNPGKESSFIYLLNVYKIIERAIAIIRQIIHARKHVLCVISQHQCLIYLFCLDFSFKLEMFFFFFCVCESILEIMVIFHRCENFLFWVKHSSWRVKRCRSSYTNNRVIQSSKYCKWQDQNSSLCYHQNINWYPVMHELVHMGNSTHFITGCI